MTPHQRALQVGVSAPDAYGVHFEIGWRECHVATASTLLNAALRPLQSTFRIVLAWLER